jgi:hypothetical protein
VQKKEISASELKDAQIFTPRWVTNEMLDLLDQDLFTESETLFFEPSAGNGEMLIVILDRIYTKLMEKYDNEKEKAIAECLFKFYAVELDEKLVVQARMKIYNFFVAKMEEDVDPLILCQIIISRCLCEKIECKNFFDVFKNEK